MKKREVSTFNTVGVRMMMCLKNLCLSHRKEHEI
jgi:hypothetical protein